MIRPSPAPAPPIPRRPFRGRRCLLLLAFALLSLCLAKVLWMLSVAQTGEALLSHASRKDLLARREYLLFRLREDTVGPSHGPEFIAPLFRGEWAVGFHSMTALSLAQIAFLHPETLTTARRGVDELLTSLLRPELRAYDREQWWGRDALEDLPDARRAHVGFLGHLNLTLAARIWLGEAPPSARDLHHRVTEGLARAMRHHPHMHGETYPRELYVMDNAAAAASIALHDRAFPDRATGAAREWASWCDHHARDEATGLLAFAIDGEGRICQGPRGSGAAWNVFFLAFIDEGMSRGEFEKIRRHLWKDFPLGLSAIAEFPPGEEGFADVDSGPVLFGMSTSGTGFAVAGARLAGRAKPLERLLRTGEFFGFTVSGRAGRRYLTAPLVGDAILLAMKTAGPWNRRWLKAHGDGL